jgi:hypothetical protein
MTSSCVALVSLRWKKTPGGGEGGGGEGGGLGDFLAASRYTFLGTMPQMGTVSPPGVGSTWPLA